MSNDMTSDQKPEDDWKITSVKPVYTRAALEAQVQLLLARAESAEAKVTELERLMANLYDCPGCGALTHIIHTESSGAPLEDKCPVCAEQKLTSQRDALQERVRVLQETGEAIIKFFWVPWRPITVHPDVAEELGGALVVWKALAATEPQEGVDPGCNHEWRRFEGDLWYCTICAKRQYDDNNDMPHPKPKEAGDAS